MKKNYEKIWHDLVSLSFTSILVGVMVAVIFGLWFIFYFHFIESIHDSILILVGLAVGFSILGFVGGFLPSLILSIIVRGASKTDVSLAVQQWWLRIVGTVILLAFFVVLLIEWQRPFAFRGFTFVFEFVIAGVMSAFIAEGSRRWGLRRRISLTKGILIIAVVIVSSFVIVLSANIFSSNAKNSQFTTRELLDINYKVAVIGIDGATWDIIDKMFAEGKLPVLRRLVNDGARAPLEAEISILNPFANSSSLGIRSSSAWTSIGTGRTYREHAVHDFLRTFVPTLHNPIPFRIPYTTGIGNVDSKFALRTLRPTSEDRRRLAVWEIVSMAGFRAGVLGWWISWPPRAIDGYMVTDRILEDIPFRWYPDTLFEQDPRLFKFSDPTMVAARFADINYVTDREKRQTLSKEEMRHMQRFDVLLSDLARDSIIYKTACELLEKEQPEFFAVYFLSPDNSEHLFWKYMDPEPFDTISQSEVDRFGQVIPRSYELLDQWLSQLIASLDEKTIIVICSDHGMGPWLNKGGLISGEELWPLNSGNHRRNGILIVSGEPIKDGLSLKTVKQIDIVPTILACMGLPVADDFKGRVLTEAFNDSVHLSWTSIDSYEDFRAAPFLTDALNQDMPSVDKEYLERLKALGYVGGGDK